MAQNQNILPLKKRQEFLAVAAHRKKWVAPAFILQTAPVLPQSRLREAQSSRGQEQTPCNGVCYFGLTASKKMIGIAVDRNRARRRLRALARAVLPVHAVTGHAFVFIARRDVLSRDFKELRADLEKSLKRLDLWREGA